MPTARRAKRQQRLLQSEDIITTFQTLRRTTDRRGLGLPTHSRAQLRSEHLGSPGRRPPGPSRREDENDITVQQVRDLLGRSPHESPSPLFVFDAGYDPVKLQRELGETPLQLLVRLHSNRVFYADPKQDGPRPVGRPRRHEAKFDLHHPASWPDPAYEHHCENEDYGSVRVRAWANLHPKSRRIGECYGCKSAPVVKETVVLVEVSKLPRQTRKPKRLWMWWHGEGEPDLDLIWRSYCRRFSLEHCIKFMKLALGWTTPRVRHPEQADRWTWSILVAYMQLVLARSVVADRKLPWEKPLPQRQ